MRDALIFLMVFGTLPFVLSRPWIGILLWCWLGFMNPHRLTWGLAYNFPFAQLAAIATLTGLLFSQERKTFPIKRETVVLMVFIAWMALTTLLALDPEAAAEQWSKV